MTFFSHLQNRRDRPRVVPGELRINGVGRGQQGSSARQIRHVGVVLVREHRVMRQAHLLRALDFRVPVRALDQPAHQAQLVFAANADHVLDQIQRSALVGLHGQAKALPLRMLLCDAGGQRFKHVERQLQPIHFFGVDRQVDVGLGRQRAQAPDARNQLGHDAFTLGVLITRMERAELDGNAVIQLGCAVLARTVSY